MAATQETLYREIDLDLSWSERDLPERERTKHVHRLHPYLGKFVPQVVEALLARHLPRAKRVLDPFAGSGTTLVQALEDGLDATGVDFPRAPQLEEYWCHKHRRTCRPIDRAAHFLRRYALDTLARVREFSRLRGRDVEARVVYGDVRELELQEFDGVVTSPPYPGL